MKNLQFIICYTLLACALSQAQDRESLKAEKEILDYAYADAIETYKNLVEEGYGEEQIFKNLGDAHYLNANYREAAGWYAKLFELEDANVDPDDMYRYAQALKSNGEYEASQIWMHKFKEATGDDVRARKFVDNPDYLKEIERRSGRYTLENLAINSSASDFAPSFNGELLVFSTARYTGTTSRKIHGWNNKPFLNLYKASGAESGQLTPPTQLSKSLNIKTHESSTAFTKDGTTVYFTRNNSENGKFSRDENGVSRLKIYRATLKGGIWTDIMELPFNGSAYSSAHPALNADESKLYFASDREGSLGQSDIFVVDIHEDGTFGTPENLGDRVNTEARETFPFISAGNVLYFASDGHPGLGGLDIYATPLDRSENPEIVNVGKPVNGEQDDFSFIIDETTGKGFFASNRDGGQGSDDLYGFTETKSLDFTCNASIEGMVKDHGNGAPLADAKVTMYNSTNERIAETVSNSDGSFALEGDCKTVKFRLLATKNEFGDGEKWFATVNADDSTDLEITLNKKAVPAKAGTNLVEILVLEPVYFDPDKADVRPEASKTIMKVIDYMNKFPEIKIQVQSHTDAKANSGYNERLSTKRAENTVAFLIANGIAPERVSGKGFGDSRLLNECDARTLCPDERHQENRRSEFVVVE